MATTRILALALLLSGAAVPLTATPVAACGWEEVGQLGPLSWHFGCIYQEACFEATCARVDPADLHDSLPWP